MNTTHRSTARFRPCAGLLMLAVSVLFAAALPAQTTSSAPYCQPAITDVNPGKGITNVTLGILTNASLVIQEYTFHNNVPVPLVKPLVSANLVVTQSVGCTTAVWVDWNQDLIFQTNEKVGEQTATSSTVPLTFQVIAPAAAANGQTRMRLRTIELGQGLDPCTGGGIGESEDYRIQIDPVLTITTQSLTPAEIGVTYSQQLAAINGVQPLTWTLLNGTLPTGIVFATVGLLTGVAQMGADAASPYPLLFRVVDSASPTPATLQIQLNLTVNSFSGAPLSVVGSVLPDGTEGSAYGFKISATGGANPSGAAEPDTFKIVAGNLPPGVLFSAAGNLSGTPTLNASAGQYSFDVQAKDPAGFTATRPFALRINTQPNPGGGPGITPTAPGLDGGGGGCAVMAGTDVRWEFGAAAALLSMAALGVAASRRLRRAKQRVR